MRTRSGEKGRLRDRRMDAAMDRAKIERDVLETAALLERPDELPPDPYFFGRVSARLAEGRGPRRGLRAALKPALIASLVVLNVATAVWFFSVRPRGLSDRNRETLIEALAGDLNLADGDQSVLFR